MLDYKYGMVRDIYKVSDGEKGGAALAGGWDRLLLSGDEAEETVVGS